MTIGIAWVFIFIAAINSTIGNVLLKQAQRVEFSMFGNPVLNFLLNPWFVGGLFFYGLNVILFAKSLEKLPVSSAYPVLASSGFVLLAVVSAYLFGESFHGKQWLGMVLVLLGIYFVSGS
ncbi:DMT family transporter [Vibrio algarum]|uniref:SMR family transporter n=1 Tax=Vibrio algarum TaxID=3020714 RepID=A0ABT4YLK0_9VIBR|nr:SMR family transporter [Vibrio sp. KJ40-1]MDB1122422.1 SMR family transporter [Vibrio sp. KJ40-1]